MSPAKGASTDAAVNEVVDFTTNKKQRGQITFTIDGHPIVAHEPKTSFMLELGRMATGSEEEQIRTMDAFIDKVFNEADNALLRERLDDDDDDFDLDDLGPIMEWLEQQWSQTRPTGKPGGSQSRRRSASRRSTARSR